MATPIITVLTESYGLPMSLMFFCIFAESLMISDPSASRKGDSTEPARTLKSSLEIAQKTIIDGSLEVLQVLFYNLPHFFSIG